VKKGFGSVRILDQVKAYRPNHLVTADDARALFGVVEMDKAAKGFLTTTSDFASRILTDPLLAKVIPSRIGLVNGEKLRENLENLYPSGGGHLLGFEDLCEDPGIVT
jgi:restriction system protein